MEQPEVWKISQFAKTVGKHNNTVDGWFRDLEQRQLHYIMRVSGEKVYDRLDLEIANYIVEMRGRDWSLNGIYDTLPKKFNLRPFPNDFQPPAPTAEPGVVDVEKLKSSILSDVKVAMEQMAVAQMQQQMEQFQRLLPSPEQQRLERFNSMVLGRRVRLSLEEEALSKWATLPPEERLVKVGWFRKTEDIAKRDQFVKQYIDERYEAKLKEEFGIDDDN